MNKIEKKTMGELLGNYHLVVPEIQREYVWGNNPNSVLEQFLASLSNRLKSNEVSNENVGFLPINQLFWRASSYRWSAAFYHIGTSALLFFS